MVKYRLPDGQQVQKLLGPAWMERGRPPDGHYTRKTAEAELRRLLTDAERGTLAGASRASGRTFGDACAEWLRYVEHEKQRAPSTLRDYRNTVNAYLKPRLGADTPLEAITTESVDALREEMLDEGHLSRRTIQKALVLLYGIFKRAKRRKWIATNPAEDAERVTVQRSGDFNVLSPVEVDATARAAGSDQEAAITTVAAFAGLRMGEMRALRWGDVDFARQTMFVRWNYTAGERRRAKSGKVRSVPLIDQAARALDRLSRREHFTGPDDLVFCSETGAFLRAEQSGPPSTRRSSTPGSATAAGATMRLSSTTCAIPSERWPYRRGRFTTFRAIWATPISRRQCSTSTTSPR